MKLTTSWISLLAVSSLALAAMAQETKEPMLTPSPTPATTTTTSTSPLPTPASSKMTSPCWEVSVEHDATYRVDGPLCSGKGPEPAGMNCPKKGDVAIAGCWKYLESYVEGGRCVAPVDAECRKIATGAWGCAWKMDGPKPTPAATIPFWPTTAGPKPTPASSVVTDPKPTPAGSVMAEPKPTPAGSVMAEPKPTPVGSVMTDPKPTAAPTDATNPKPTPAPTGSTAPQAMPTATTKNDPALPVNASSFDSSSTIKITTDAPEANTQSATTLSSGSNDTTAAGTPVALIVLVAAVAGVALVAIGVVYYRRRTTRQLDFSMGTPNGAFESDKKRPNALLSVPRQTMITA